MRTVEAIAPVFGGINLEDISAPRCFEIERRLRESLDIPVFHDDQHGTAIVVLAALLNALRVVGKRIEDVRIVTTGCGAAGMAVTRTLQHAGVGWIVGCDEGGALYRGRDGLTPRSRSTPSTTNPDNLQGTRRRATRGRRRLHRRLGARRDQRRGRARDGAARDRLRDGEPEPRGRPGGDRGARRGDRDRTQRLSEPDQQRPRLPRLFRGALDVRAREIDAGMELAAAQAIATAIADDELSPDYIIPSVFNRAVAPAVAAAVAEAAQQSGVARRSTPAAPVSS